MDAELTHTDILDLLPAYVLGALEPDEMLQVAAYLEAHPELEASLAEAEEALAQVAYLAPDASLPPNAKQRLMDRVKGATVVLTPRASAPAPARNVVPIESLWMQLRNLFWPARWGLAIAMLLGLLLWNVRLQSALRESAALEQIADVEGTSISLMIETPAAPNATGRLFLPPEGSTGVIAVSGLPTLPPGKDYQFWFARPDKSRDSAAVFDVGPNGEALIKVTVPQNLAQYNEIWITQEPDGGSAVPTAPHYLEGPLVQ